MKFKSGLILMAAVLLIAACSSPAPAAETVMEDEMAVEEEVMTATEPAAMEDVTEDAMVEAPAEEMAADDTMMADESMTSEVSFSQDVWPIIEEYALAAHGGKGGVFLESYDDILNYVTPGDPENSMLYKSLIGDGMEQMPPNGPLPDEMIQTIYDWIEQGALNN